MLGMERQWLGLQVRCHGLRRRWTRRNRFWSFCACILDDSRKTSREDDAELPPAQRFVDHSRNRLSVVRMARVQRRFCFRCQPSCYNGLLELQLDCHVRCNYLGSSRLETRSQVVHGRLVFRLYLWFGRCYPRFWIHYTLGQCCSRYRYWRSL